MTDCPGLFFRKIFRGPQNAHQLFLARPRGAGKCTPESARSLIPEPDADAELIRPVAFIGATTSSPFAAFERFQVEFSWII